MPKQSCMDVDFGVFLDLWNRTQNQQTPAIHFRIANWLQGCWARGDRRLLLQAFRASGKSTITALFSAWMLCKDPDLRILVLAAESSLSQKMVRMTRAVIERHPLTKFLIPPHPDQWTADHFTVARGRVSRDPSVLARGIYANITGARADLIICDDVEVPNTCDTPEKRIKLRTRLLENAFILTPQGTQFYIGTPHSFFSIYANVPRAEIGEDQIFLKGYHRLTIPIMDRQGQSNWPERYDAAAIEKIRTASGPLQFESQMMLRPMNILQSRLIPSLLTAYDDDLSVQEVQQSMILKLGGRMVTSASAWWDPAFAADKNDRSVLAVALSDGEGRHYLHRLTYIKPKTAMDGEDEATHQCLQVCAVAKELCLPSISVETNGIGRFLPAILRRELANAKIPCAVVERHSTAAKDDRILTAFDAVMAARMLFVHRGVYATPFIQEMAEWRPGLRSFHDDGLDAAAGALLQEPVRIKAIQAAGTRYWKHTQTPQGFDV